MKEFEDRAVCLKVIRTYTKNEDLTKKITHESILWGKSRTAGFQYLHANGIVHDDLKGVCRSSFFLLTENLSGFGVISLIDGTGRACLTDFGISATSAPEIIGWVSTSSVASKGGSVRWQAPELFDITEDTVVKNTEKSDVYMHGLVSVRYSRALRHFPLSSLDLPSSFDFMQGTHSLFFSIHYFILGTLCHGVWNIRECYVSTRAMEVHTPAHTRLSRPAFLSRFRPSSQYYHGSCR
ncbi:hypothetical protein E4T56_gene12645 [Termitomyces sp. T112]|nr:hypothetical protein E4T56_gene12645 [Termitomyces sp. T112]